MHQIDRGPDQMALDGTFTTKSGFRISGKGDYSTCSVTISCSLSAATMNGFLVGTVYEWAKPTI